MSAPLLLKAFIEGWTPLDPKHRILGAAEIRDIMTNAKRRK